MIEIAVACVLLAAAMVATVQVIGWVVHDRKAVERRERAVAEASNLMERISGRPWDDLTTESLASTKLSEVTTAFLPGAKLDVQLASLVDVPPRKKITLEIRWRDRSGRLEAPVRIVAWVHHHQGASPR